MALPTISGEFRAGADPDLRFTPSGKAVCDLRAVASSRKKDDQGEWHDDRTCWLKITSFNKLAENVFESIAKGDLVSVSGRLEIQEWEDRDGNRRITPVILADTIGPSLAWATARVAKSERSGGGQQSSRSADPWERSKPADDEPPF